MLKLITPQNYICDLIFISISDTNVVAHTVTEIKHSLIDEGENIGQKYFN